jgi:hypothetical protein
MVRRYSVFSVRRRTQPPNLPGSPANITPKEQEKALYRVDLALAKANRKYAWHIVHGGSDDQLLRDRAKLIRLENEKRSLQNMQPVLPGHISRAEKSL